jgi:ribonuclease R
VIKPTKTEAEIQEKRDYRKELRTIARNPDMIKFPKELAKELDALSETIPPDEIAKRRDFRHLVACTIDPDDAQDFDDALSVEFLPNDQVQIGIHIADVGHYVRENTKLDREAYKRGTSIYLTGTVIPMLPEKISNDLCSLRADVDRLCFSVVVTFDAQNRIVDTWLGKGIITSKKRFTYTQAQKIIDAKKGEHARELLELKRIADVLTHTREVDGALFLEDTEIRFVYDADRNPIGVQAKVRLDTHKLVEEFMLLANRLVAEQFAKHDIFVYRIHDEPDREKLNIIREHGHEYGIEIPKKLDNHILNTLIRSIEDEDIRSHFSKIIMRSMAKAVYSSHNIGHYGLAFKQYTHFTSPIRRYPDLITHRLLLAKLAHTKTQPIDQNEFEKKLIYLSTCERKAQDVERASTKDMQIKYMGRFIGMERIGVVTGLTDIGIYVSDKESLSEGFIHAKNLGRDWKYNDRASFWKSEKLGKIKLGDHITFKVDKVNFDKGFIDLSLCKKN